MKKRIVFRRITGSVLLITALVCGVAVYEIEYSPKDNKDTKEMYSADAYTIDKKVLSMPEVEEPDVPVDDYDVEDLSDQNTNSLTETIQTAGQSLEVQPENDMDLHRNLKEQTVDTSTGSAIGFNEYSRISWPIEGTILMDYSMDETVYFSTLNVYKCNPAVVIQAKENDAALAACAGTVKNVFTDDETGGTVVVDLGNGYEATYGQLTDIAVSKGDPVKEGQLLGKISEPTRYYKNEGVNLYFGMTKDNKPIDPAMYTETLYE